MSFFEHFQGKKAGNRPRQIIFEKENTENTYITWEDKMKPRIRLDDGIAQDEYQALAARWNEMLALAEEILWRSYLDPNSEDLMSDGYIYRDTRGSAYHVKEGRLRHKHHNGKEWLEEWQELDSPEITRYYNIFLGLRLTGNEDGKEQDYMGLDLIAELETLADPIEFEILSHDVI